MMGEDLESFMVILRNLAWARRRAFSWSLAVLIATVGLGARHTRAQAGRRTLGHEPSIRVKPSPFYNRLDRYAREHPKASEEELASFANQQLAEVGVDYPFEVGDFLKRRNLKPVGRRISDEGEDESLYAVSLRLRSGQRSRFILAVGDEGPCGERIAALPITDVSKSTISLVADGRKWEIGRPPGFVLDSMQWVDESMQRVLGNWEVPFNGDQPAGISPSGTTLYLDRYAVSGRRKLWIGISQGRIQVYATASAGHQSAGEWVEKHPTDPNNSYLSFMRFLVNGKPMIIRFTAPCA